MLIKPISALLLGLAMVFACAAPAQAQQAAKGPVKVFILAGQSNMEGHGKIEGKAGQTEPGTLRHMVTDPELAPTYKKELLDDAGQWVLRKDVWVWYHAGDRKGNLTVGYGGSKDLFGPELGFGLVVGKHLDEQVLIIKTAWGGKSLDGDFHPPSSGGEAGEYYKLMMTYINDVLANLKQHFPEYDGQGYTLAGFGWHQGWNDGCNADQTQRYEANIANFIRDVRKDLGVKDLPFVIANSGFGGWNQKVDRRLGIINAQLAVAQYDEFKGNVFTVETRDFWRPREQSPSGQGYHWFFNAETHYLIGTAMGSAMVDLLKKVPPNDKR